MSTQHNAPPSRPVGRGLAAAGEPAPPGFPPADGALRTARALARMAALPSEEPDSRRLLARLATLVRDAVPAADWVSIGVGSPLDPVRLGTDGPTAADFDGRQVRAGQGPAPDAHAGGTAVDTADVTVDPRWPGLGRPAGESPVRSVLALPVRESTELTGVLCLYAAAPRAFDAGSRHLADLVASAVSAALCGAAERRALRELAGHLEQALTSRATIDQAKGMLMARFGGGADDAFARLVGLSNRLNVRLRHLAVLITEGHLDELLLAAAGRGSARVVAVDEQSLHPGGRRRRNR